MNLISTFLKGGAKKLSSFKQLYGIIKSSLKQLYVIIKSSLKQLYGIIRERRVPLNITDKLQV